MGRQNPQAAGGSEFVGPMPVDAQPSTSGLLSGLRGAYSGFKGRLEDDPAFRQGLIGLGAGMLTADTPDFGHALGRGLFGYLEGSAKGRQQELEAKRAKQQEQMFTQKVAQQEQQQQQQQAYMAAAQQTVAQLPEPLRNQLAPLVESGSPEAIQQAMGVASTLMQRAPEQPGKVQRPTYLVRGEDGKPRPQVVHQNEQGLITDDAGEVIPQERLLQRLNPITQQEQVDTGVKYTPAVQAKLIKELTDNAAGAGNMLRQVNEITREIENNPNVIGVPGNVATVVSNLGHAVSGVVDVALSSMTPEQSAKVEAKLENALSSKKGRFMLPGVDLLAEEAAPTRTALKALIIAKAKSDSPNRAPTDKDVENAANELMTDASNPRVLIRSIKRSAEDTAKSVLGRFEYHGLAEERPAQLLREQLETFSPTKPAKKSDEPPLTAKPVEALTESELDRELKRLLGGE